MVNQLDYYALHGLLLDKQVARTTMGGRDLNPALETPIGLYGFKIRSVSWGKVKGNSPLNVPDESRFLGLVPTGDLSDVVPILAVQAGDDELQALREFNFRNVPFREITVTVKKTGIGTVNITVPVLKNLKVGKSVRDSFADPFLMVGISREEAITIAKAARRDLGFPELTAEGQRAAAKEAEARRLLEATGSSPRKEV